MEQQDFLVQSGFPAVLTPVKSKLSFENFLLVIQSNQNFIKKSLLKYGALLFRGFPLSSAKTFSQSISCLNLGKFINYIGGDSPRDKIEEGVYTSTEAPPSLHIPLHQELSFIKNFPRHIYFFCDTAPQLGGETIIADARKVYQAFPQNFRDHFETNQLTYTSRYYYQSAIMRLLNRWQRSHKSWTEVFETQDKSEVEKKCRLNEFNFKWLPHTWLEIKQTRPALHQHPETGELVWFNQAHLYDFNPRLLGISKYIAAKIFYRKNTLLHEIAFANGNTIPKADLYFILDILEQNTARFSWHRGDWLILDNILAMHGRAPFKGPRKILTSLTS